LADLETFDKPPALDAIADALGDLLKGGLPATEETASRTLLGLRGVWARAVDPDDILSRVKALNTLLAQEIPRIPAVSGRDWAAGAVILFRIHSSARTWNLVRRYHEAARIIPYNEDHFRQEVVPKILRQLARQLYEDSQLYISRSRGVPPQHASGDTPIIQPDQLATRERAKHEEDLSRLWEYVYGLRAELIAVQRLTSWPDDEYNDEKLRAAHDSSLWQLARLLQSIYDYLNRYGERIMHGEAEFNVEALIRLAGWRGELPKELAYRLRLLVAQHPVREPFIAAAQEQGLAPPEAG
jgi:hypothetical protein